MDGDLKENLADRFIKPDGTPTKCLRGDDLLHLTVEGYRAWAEGMEPIVARFVGERKAKKVTSLRGPHVSSPPPTAAE